MIVDVTLSRSHSPTSFLERIDCMLAVLRQRNLALLWLGNVVSLLGNWILLVALPFYIYQETGSVLATGAMFIVETIPTLVLGSLAGVFADRWDRRRTLIVTNMVQ